MPTLQIDLEAARSTVATLRQSHDDLAAELAALAGAVDALLPTWDGNGKSQFAPAWEQWQRAMGDVLAAVTGLATGIEREAAEYEAAAATSSFR